MANRLTKIYTRTGDDGTTGLSSGERVLKNAPRLAAMGDVDELNSMIGLLLCEELPAAMIDCLSGIQHDLFDLGGELSLPGHTVISATHVTRLETILDSFNDALPPLKNFILPGGSRAAALAHLARAICRRSERSLVSLAQDEADAAPATALMQYINRLSDLLFVLARVASRHGGGEEIYWQLGRNR